MLGNEHRTKWRQEKVQTKGMIFFFPYPSVSSNRRSSEEGRRSLDLGERREVAVVSGWLGKISVSS